jgi:hypothetical protein
MVSPTHRIVSRFFSRPTSGLPLTRRAAVMRTLYRKMEKYGLACVGKQQAGN